jgi:hypothetical protein
MRKNRFLTKRTLKRNLNALPSLRSLTRRELNPSTPPKRKLKKSLRNFSKLRNYESLKIPKLPQKPKRSSASMIMVSKRARRNTIRFSRKPKLTSPKSKNQSSK